MKNTTLIKEIPLSHTQDGAITVATVSEPYGNDSDPIVSIAVWLAKSSEEPDWKVHIPAEDIDDIISALQEAKAKLA